MTDYAVFMAASQRSGKNNSGAYVFRTDAVGGLIDDEGRPITESAKMPAINHDLDEIAEAFVAWGKQQGLGFLLEE